MFTAFSTALSGLNAMTDAIDVVGNNLANLNTTGYKNTVVSFHELISQALGGNASSQVGLGTERPDTMSQYTQGSIQTTGGQYDEAIQGDGFFVVKNAGGQTLYTRDGGFKVDASGYLVTAGGEFVQGWTGMANGSVNTNGVLGDIQVPTGTLSQPVATKTFSIGGNLNSSTTPIVPLTVAGTATGTIAITSGVNDKLSLGINGAAAQTFTLDPLDTSVTAAAADLQLQFNSSGIAATAGVDSSGGLLISSTSPAANAGVQVYGATANSPLGLSITSTASTSNNTFSSGEVVAVDSLGNKIPLTLSFTKDTTNGTWSYSLTSSQGTLTSGGKGTIQFDPAGKMTGISSPTISPDGKSDILTISNLPDGAADFTMSWNFYNTDGTPKLTQYSATSSASSNDQDGQVASELTSVSLGNGGQVLAQYAAGPQSVVGVLAMATVRNPTSLLGETDNNLGLGAGTAIPTIGVAGTGGRGTLEGGSLESSTVDIASQFSNLLTYERSYQANSRVITVSDTISQETVNLIK